MLECLDDQLLLRPAIRWARIRERDGQRQGGEDEEASQTSARMLVCSNTLALGHA